MANPDIVHIHEVSYRGPDPQNCMITVYWTDADGDQGATWGYSDNPAIKDLLTRWEQQRREP